MTFRKFARPRRLQPAAHDPSRFRDSLAVDAAACAVANDRWRDLARSLARRLMPVTVLVAAALLGLAAVALA